MLIIVKYDLFIMKYIKMIKYISHEIYSRVLGFTSIKVFIGISQ